MFQHEIFCNSGIYRHNSQQDTKNPTYSKIATYQSLTECSVHHAGLYVYNNEQKNLIIIIIIIIQK